MFDERVRHEPAPGFCDFGQFGVTFLNRLFEKLDHRRSELPRAGVVDMFYHRQAVEFVLGGYIAAKLHGRG